MDFYLTNTFIPGDPIARQAYRYVYIALIINNLQYICFKLFVFTKPFLSICKTARPFKR